MGYKKTDKELNDLQLRTLIRIFGVCPRPSTTVINMISAEMKLPKECIVDFFVLQHQKKRQDSLQHMAVTT